MEINELYLKTAFCCMACDGDIATEEIEWVRQYSSSSTRIEGIDVQQKLDEYIAKINATGKGFLSGYLNDIACTPLDEQQELNLAKIAIEMIEADNEIKYSEISFFKRIRSKLKMTDDKLLTLLKEDALFEKFPEVEPEDFLLPDISEDDDMDLTFSFENIVLSPTIL